MAHYLPTRFQIVIRPENPAENRILAKLNRLNGMLGPHFAHLAKPHGWRMGYLKAGDCYIVIGTRPELKDNIRAIISQNGFVANRDATPSHGKNGLLLKDEIRVMA